MESIDIRVATSDDGDSIANFAKTLAEDPFISKSKWLKVIGENNVLPLLAFNCHEVIGKIQARVIDSIGWIESARISPKFRNQGIGQQLIGKALDWLKNQNIQIIRTSVDSDNITARRIIEKFQFTPHFLVVNPIKELDLNSKYNGYLDNLISVLDPNEYFNFTDLVKKNMMSNIMVDGKYLPFTEELFTSLVKEKRVYSNRSHDLLLIISVNTVPYDIQGCLISKTLDGYLKGSKALIGIAAEELVSTAICHSPSTRIAIKGLIINDYGWIHPHSLIIYQMTGSIRN